jgi:hypothetical protein
VCARAREQQGFEARLGERLAAADAALRRQVEASLARLEEKLDRLAHATACPCCSRGDPQPSPASPASPSRQRSGQRPPPLRPGVEGEGFEAKGGGLQPASPSELYAVQWQPEQDRQKGLPVSLERRLDQIASAVGVKAAGEEEDDRKRLKEKLKLALERDKQRRIRTIVSEHAKWLEYVFGICKADQRLGKRGSRWLAQSLSSRQNWFLPIWFSFLTG